MVTTRKNVCFAVVLAFMVVYLTFFFSVVASSAPFVVRPSHLGGFIYALVAVQSTIDSSMDETVRLRDALPPLPPTMGNWRDYYNFITNDQTATYYNVRACASFQITRLSFSFLFFSQVAVAHPTSPCISISTRLQIFEDDPSVKTVNFFRF
jgi:hypothetical protein